VRIVRDPWWPFRASVFSLIPIPTGLLSTDESFAVSHLNRFSQRFFFPRLHYFSIRSKPALGFSGNPRTSPRLLASHYFSWYDAPSRLIFRHNNISSDCDHSDKASKNLYSRKHLSSFVLTDLFRQYRKLSVSKISSDIFYKWWISNLRVLPHAILENTYINHLQFKCDFYRSFANRF